MRGASDPGPALQGISDTGNMHGSGDFQSLIPSTQEVLLRRKAEQGANTELSPKHQKSKFSKSFLSWSTGLAIIFHETDKTIQPIILYFPSEERM